MTIRRINAACLLRRTNLHEYGRVPDDHQPGQPHKGSSVLHALVHSYIVPLTNKDTIVLDLGCRNLDLAVFLATKVGRVVNVDISPEVVAWAMRHGFDSICASADELPLASNSVDIFHASHVFEHVPDLARSLFEALRVLRLGGHLFVRVPLRSYYRHHRFYIGSADSMVAEIEKQCTCEIIRSEERVKIGHPEAVLLVKKVEEPRFCPQQYPYDLVGTLRSLFWRVRHCA